MVSAILGVILTTAASVIFLSLFYDITSKKKAHKKIDSEESVDSIEQLFKKFEEISLEIFKKGYAFVLNRKVSKVNFKKKKYKKMSNFSLIIFSLILIPLQTYSIYVAATLKSNALLMIGCGATILWLIIGTWYHSLTSIKNKILLTLSAPFMYFLVYVKSIGFLFSKVFL